MTEPTEAAAAAADPPPSSPSTPGPTSADEGDNHLSGKGILLAVGFAAFAAYVAADFATGGALTAWVVLAVTAARGRVPKESTTDGA